MDAPSLLLPCERLVRIRIGGRWFSVPENNPLLRGFQFLAPGVSYGPFCWNGDCHYDRIVWTEPGGGRRRCGFSCKVLPTEGMVIEELSAELESVLAPLLEPRRDGGA